MNDNNYTKDNTDKVRLVKIIKNSIASITAKSNTYKPSVEVGSPGGPGVKSPSES